MIRFVFALALLFACGVAQACDYGAAQLRLQSNGGYYNSAQLQFNGGYGHRNSDLALQLALERARQRERNRQRFFAPTVRVAPFLSIRVR